MGILKVISKIHNALTPIGSETVRPRMVTVIAWHVFGAVQVIIVGVGIGRNVVINDSALASVDPGETQTVGMVWRLSTGAGFAATAVARARVIMATNDFIVMR